MLHVAIFLGFALLGPHVTAQYDYTEVLEKSILFYEAERSGTLPGNNRIPWRGNSALGDGSDNGLDLTGGWYDAGDHVKFNFPMAFSVTTLAWGIVDFRTGYENSGQLNNALDSIRWPLDYFLKCHVSDDLFYGQVGDIDVDHGYWGRPEDMTMFRPSWNINTGAPGSDLAGETAAAFAASSLAFQSTDAAYAAELLSHARTLYDFAYNFRGIYSQSIPNAAGGYGSSGFNDELAWGAIWLYRATGEQIYLDRALEFYSAGTPWAYSWDDKNAGVQLMLFMETGDPQYASALEGFIRSYMPGGGLQYTPGGLAYRDQWGVLRYSANAAFIAILAEQQDIMAGEARAWGKGQIDYMLGSTGRSYVVGFGNNPPQRPHHRAASCADSGCNWDDFNSPNPNPNVLNGALVGGPDVNDQFTDDRTDFISNEVACDYNAGFQSAIAGLI